LADAVTGFMGSWRFITVQTAIVAIWLTANIVLLTRPFDPFPFILLNLAFSTQAAYAAPLILLAGNRAAVEVQLRAHVGNYSLFLTGIFHENTQRRSLRGAPDLAFYEQIGRTNYQLVAAHATARRCELSDVYEELAGRFHEVRLALNRLSEQLLNLDEDSGIALQLQCLTQKSQGITMK